MAKRAVGAEQKASRIDALDHAEYDRVDAFATGASGDAQKAETFGVAVALTKRPELYQDALARLEREST